MSISKNDIYLYVYFIFLTIIVSFFVANRDLYNVADTMNYANNFLNKTTMEFYYEFLFELLTYFIRLLSDSYFLYFFVLNVILNFLILRVSIVISDIFNLNKLIFFIFLFSIFIYSSWYYTASTNGLRQGLALLFCYYSFVSYLVHRSKIKFFLIFIASCFFHYSNFLILPFILLYKLSLNKIFLLLNLCGIFYFFNFNEIIVKEVSYLLSLPLYDQIKNYNEFDLVAYRYGFQLDLFLYTMFFVCVYWLYSNFVLKGDLFFLNIVKFYYILVFPYFVFGFAAYSNRYGFIAWFFSVFLNGFILYVSLLKFGKNYFRYFVVFLFLISTIFFYYRFV